MAKASWMGVTLAESDNVEEVEGNLYFPPDAIAKAHFEESSHHTVCGWKGVASYYHVVVDGKRNENAAWFYPVTKDAAKKIEGYVAFWKGVSVER
ncbi:MAG: DUF427 domain-containing protein [Myxococcota bacterium]